MSSSQELSTLLFLILGILGTVFVILVVILIAVSLKQKKAKTTEEVITTNEKAVSDARKIAKEYTKESIFKFMEFEKVEDNMIVQKNGNRYLMAIECQGVNYDLMSENEKVSVEEGFLQFLNTLRHPIQIYIQTRTVNLNDSIESYRRKIDEIETELERKKLQYQQNLNSGRFTKEQLEKQFYEVTKQINLYEYGKDIIANTERMSLNKSVLSKKYYIIIPYYVEEVGEGAFDKEEIRNLAFSELYTKAQSLIRTLSGCEVSGKVMNSTELVDLLYTAYNRDEAEVFSVDKAIRSGYDELYTTAPDVLDKKMKMIDEQIEEKALDMVNDTVIEARNQKEQEIYEKEVRFAELIRQRAEMILNQNENYLGKETVEGAKKIIKKRSSKNKEIEEQTEIEEMQNYEEKEVEEKPKRGRKKAVKSENESITKEKGGKKNGSEKTRKTNTK